MRHPIVGFPSVHSSISTRRCHPSSKIGIEQSRQKTRCSLFQEWTRAQSKIDRQSGSGVSVYTTMIGLPTQTPSPFSPTAYQFCGKCCHVPPRCARPLFLRLQCDMHIDVCVPSPYVGTLARSSIRQTMMSWRASVTRCATYVPLIDPDVLSGLTTVRNAFTQVCKFPDKTQQRKTNLSDEDYAKNVISGSTWNAGYEDDEGSEGQKPQLRQPAPVSAGAHTKALNRDQMTLRECLESVPLQGFKRPNANGQDKVVLRNSKRAKVEQPKDEPATKGSGTSTNTTGCLIMPPPLGTSVVLFREPPFSSSRLIEDRSVTRPHRSANSLRKPFKTPFKTPSLRQDHVAKANDHDSIQAPERTVSSAPVQRMRTYDEVDEDDVEIAEVTTRQGPAAGHRRKPNKLLPP